MLTLTILDIISKLDELQKAQQSAELDILITSFIIQVKDEYGTDAATWLTVILQHLGLKEFTIEDTTDNALLTLVASKAEHYDKILPLCHLALIIEQNGVAEDHAYKLARIFTDLPSVLKYLLQFKNENAYRYLLHDACLFELPEPTGCEFDQWQKIAQRYLSNPRFRTLLPYAGILEELGSMGKHRIKHEGQALKLDETALADIKALQQQLSAVASEYKKIKKHTPVVPADRKARQEKLQQLNLQRAEQQAKLVALCKGRLPLANVSMLVLEALYNQYLQKQSPAYYFLVQYGLTPKAIEQFFLLKTDAATDTIPDVCLDGKDIGYPGYYLKKLDVTSTMGAAIAACLGKLTACCQYLGGAGNDCVLHGITSAYGGFYVLYQGDMNHPLTKDKIIAQTWVWQGQTGGLCFDSIETIKKAQKSVVTDMYRWLAHTLCQEHGILQVNTGTDSGITNQVAHKDYITQKEYFQDYDGYCDSNKQLLLARASMPYLFYGERTSGLLQEKISISIGRLMNTLWVGVGALHLVQSLQQVIAFALIKNNNALLNLIIESFPIEQRTTVEAIVLANRTYFDQLKKGVIDFEALKQGANLDLYNHKGQNALHIAVLDQDVNNVRNLINLGINLDHQDSEGRTALFCALHVLYEVYALHALYKDKKVARRDIVHMLLAAKAQPDIQTYVIKNTSLMLAVRNQDLDMVNTLLNYNANLELYDIDKETVLFKAARIGNETILTKLLNHGARVQHIGGEKKTILIAALMNQHWHIAQIILKHKEAGFIYQDDYGINALRHAVGNLTIFNTILNLLSDKQRLKVFNTDTNILEYAADYPESFKLIFTLIPESQRLEVLSRKNASGRRSFHEAIHHIENLNTILTFLPKDQQPGLSALISKQNARGQSALYYTANYPESFKLIFTLIPESQRLEVLSRESAFDERIFDKAIPHIENLNTILTFLPKDQQSGLSALISKQNKQGKNALYYAANYPESFKLIFTLIPESQRLEVLSRENVCGERSFDKAIPHIENLNTILTFLPKDQQPGLSALINKQNKQGKNALYYAANYPESFKLIFTLIPESQRLELLSVEDKSGQTAFAAAAQHPETFKSILELLSKDQCLELLKIVDKAGYTVLHRAALCSETLKIIIATIAENKYLELLTIPDRAGNTVLHYAAQHHEIFKSILELLSKDQCLELLKIVNKEGYTVLHRAALYSETLKIIIATIAENKYLELLTIPDRAGNTVLHYAAQHPEIFKSILELLSKNQCLELLQVQNNVGFSPYDLANNRRKSIQATNNWPPYRGIWKASLPKNTSIFRIEFNDPEVALSSFSAPRQG